MGNRQHTVVQPYWFITNICVLRPMERNRGRWNRETWHQRGTRLNEDVRAWLNRGSSEQSSVQTTGRERRYATMSNIRRRVMHFRTASFVRRLGSYSRNVQATSSRTTGAANVIRRSRLCSKHQSLRTARVQWFLPRVADAGHNGSVLAFTTNALQELLSSATQYKYNIIQKIYNARTCLSVGRIGGAGSRWWQRLKIERLLQLSVYFDATFKVVPTIYYQLFTLFVPFANFAFPVCYALMSRNKTTELYVKVFAKVLYSSWCRNSHRCEEARRHWRDFNTSTPTLA